MPKQSKVTVNIQPGPMSLKKAAGRRFWQLVAEAKKRGQMSNAYGPVFKLPTSGFTSGGGDKGKSPLGTGGLREH